MMRLTLRTLLAYLDGILAPADARDLERKIAESELASQLIERIRALQADRHAAAVRIGGADANDVANYLDNTMEPQRVSDFERICLDSDAHLGEVAACHQILTRVLSEEMKTPASLRRRLIQLSQTKETASRDAASKQSASKPGAASGVSRTASLSGSAMGASREALRVDPPARSARAVAPSADDGWDADEHWTTAPDYLKQAGKRTWKSLATIAGISICLLLAALRGMGPFNHDHPLAHYVEPLAERWGVKISRNSPIAAVPDEATSPATDSRGADVISADARSVDASGSDPRSALASPSLGADAERPAGSSPATEPSGDTGASAADSGPAASEAIDTEIPKADLVSPATSIPADEGSASVAAENEAAPVASPESSTSEPSAALMAEAETAAGGLLNPLAEEPAAAANENGDASSASPSDEGATESIESPEGDAAVAAREREPGMELINPLEDPAETDGGDSAKPAPGIAAPEKVTDAGALGAADGKPIHLKPEAPDAATADLGRFLNEQQVLLHGQSSDATWQRLAPGDRLQVGQQLLSLPTFRPPILLESGLQVSLIGATRVEVLPPSDDAMPRFGLHFGRLAVAAFTSEGSKCGLQWGADQNGSLTLDAMTSVAMELTRRYLPGDNPETSETPPFDVLMLYVTSGSAVWVRAGAEPLTLPAGTRLVQVNDREPIVSAFSSTPTWIEGRDARPRDPIAAQDLGTRVTLDRPATQTLRELASERRLEVRSLAACSLAYTGDLDPLLDALGDAKLRSYWPVQYEVLLHRMNLGPDSVREVRDALRRRHGNADGEALYRMLLGFSPQQLAEGGASTLVDYLDHPLTEFRFAANETLRAITGLPSLYQAHANERQRRPAVAKWRTHLQQNKIAYVEPPELVRFLNTEVAPPAR